MQFCWVCKHDRKEAISDYKADFMQKRNANKVLIVIILPVCPPCGGTQMCFEMGRNQKKKPKLSNRIPNGINVKYFTRRTTLCE